MRSRRKDATVQLRSFLDAIRNIIHFWLQPSICLDGVPQDHEYLATNLTNLAQMVSSQKDWPAALKFNIPICELSNPLLLQNPIKCSLFLSRCTLKKRGSGQRRAEHDFERAHAGLAGSESADLILQHRAGRPRTPAEAPRGPEDCASPRRSKSNTE